MSVQGLSFSVENLLGLQKKSFHPPSSTRPSEVEANEVKDATVETENDHSEEHVDRRVKRRRRILFSDTQIDILKNIFKKQKYLSVERRKSLAETLNLSPKQVKTWFQNHRYKCRRKSMNPVGFPREENMVSPLGTLPLATPVPLILPSSGVGTIAFRNKYIDDRCGGIYAPRFHAEQFYPSMKYPGLFSTDYSTAYAGASLPRSSERSLSFSYPIDQARPYIQFGSQN